MDPIIDLTDLLSIFYLLSNLIWLLAGFPPTNDLKMGFLLIAAAALLIFITTRLHIRRLRQEGRWGRRQIGFWTIVYGLLIPLSYLPAILP